MGYDTIADLLRGHMVFSVLLGLLVVKSVIWAVALSSGTSGGVVAPLLIIGGALGGVGAHLLHSSDPGLWAMVTMAAVMGGTMNAPFTAIVFALELTLDVHVLPALLIACFTADAVTVLVLKRSILTEKVARHGHHVAREYSVSPLQRLLVGQVMDEKPPTLPAASPISDVSRRLREHDPVLVRHHAWPVLGPDGRLAGILTRGDLLHALQSAEADGRPVLDFATRELCVTYPDELLEDAVEKMAARGVGRLPVVAREDERTLLGYLGRTGLLEAYFQRLQEEEKRETGVVAEAVRPLGRGVLRMLAPFRRNGS